MSFNKIIIVGNLGKDPELRYTPAGVAVCSFSVATTEKRKDSSGEMQEQTTWFKVTLWRERAEAAAKYLKKGSPVYIEGRLKIEEWQDRENNNRFTLDVQATEMQFIGGGTQSKRQDAEPTEEVDDETDVDDDEDVDEDEEETVFDGDEVVPPKAKAKAAAAGKAGTKAKKDKIPF